MTQEHIREVCWEIGKKYPAPFTSEFLTISMIYPRRGYLQWHVNEASVHALQWRRLSRLAPADSSL